VLKKGVRGPVAGIRPNERKGSRYVGSKNGTFRRDHSIGKGIGGERAGSGRRNHKKSALCGLGVRADH